jgi:hypothetical protein
MSIMTTSLKEELKQTPIAFGCTNETTFMQTTCSSDAITAAILAASNKTKRGWIAQTSSARQSPKQAPYQGV